MAAGARGVHTQSPARGHCIPDASIQHGGARRCRASFLALVENALATGIPMGLVQRNLVLYAAFLLDGGDDF